MENSWSWMLLCGAAFLAGVVNAIAGGGTLLTFPSLLAVISPVEANASSTFALFPASLASGLGYRDELAQNRRHLVRLLPPSLIGGLLGSLLVTRLDPGIFRAAVPWLLITASVLLVLQRPLAKRFGARRIDNPTPKTLAGVVLFQLLVGIYGGYFGAGIGILMLSSLAFTGITEIHEMNAVKSILAAAMNAISLVIFLMSGVIVWKYALVMAAAGIAGGYAGARIARRTRPEIIRAMVVAIGFGVAIYSWIGRK